MVPAHLATAITAVLVAAFWFALYRLMAGSERRLAWTALLTVPLSLVVNLWVKAPVYRAVASVAGVAPEAALAALPLWFLAFRLLLPPVTEEAVKVLPLLARTLRARLGDGRAALWLGMYLGLGFGIGEIGYLGWRLGEVPALAGYPVWMYYGFLTERLLATFGHGVMTAVTLTGARSGARGATAGYLAAVGLHALGNLGALLGKMGTIGPAATQATVIAAFLLLVLVFLRLHGRSARGRPAEQQVYFRRPQDPGPG